MKEILKLIVLVIGEATLVYGVWQISRPAFWITTGGVLIIMALDKSKKNGKRK